MPPFLGAGFVSGGSLAKYHSPSGSTADLYNFAAEIKASAIPFSLLGFSVSKFPLFIWIVVVLD